MDDSVQAPTLLEGRTVIITGAANGIGRAVALGFLRDGARVVGADVDEQGLASLTRAGALVKRADVSVFSEVQALIAFAIEQTGRIDVLMNNAGHGVTRRMDAHLPDEFERMVRVHLFGMVYGLQAALPIMRAQGYGRILNTLSRGAEFSAPGNGAYSAAKAGMWAATRAAARENSDTDILINGYIPGPTNTAIWGRDRPELQSPEVTYPTARMLATLPKGGPTGQVFWNERVYRLMDPANDPQPIGPGTSVA